MTTAAPQLSPEERLSLARIITGLLNNWNIAARDQIALLALPGKVRAREMKKFGEDLPFPDVPEVIERAAHLLGIADALRTTYPLNDAMGGIWMHRVNRRFQDRSPLQKMLEEGLRGIIEVRIHLDCAFGWRRDASNPDSVS